MASHPKSKSNYHKCWFTGCARTKRQCPPGIHFFTFPIKRPQVCEQWVLNCANKSLMSLPQTTLSNRSVCGAHFTDDCFTSTMKNRLKKYAVPTLSVLDGTVSQTPQQTTIKAAQSPTTTSLPNEPSSGSALFSSPAIGCSCESPIRTPLYKKLRSISSREQTPGELAPRKRNLLKKLNTLSKHRKKFHQSLRRSIIRNCKLSKEDLLGVMKSYLPEKVASFFSMQLNHVAQATKQYSDKEKQQALVMRYKSPSLYDQMRSDGFALPCPLTIARWLQGIHLRTGVCGELLHFMNIKVKCMSEMERKIVLMFDEVAIKYGLDYDSKKDLVEGLVDLGEEGRKSLPGSKVLLFMVRGLVHKWKMPVAYYVVHNSVTANTICRLVTNCISALATTGLEVKAVVCDQGLRNRRAATLLGVSKDDPFFFVDSKKIHFLYDFPHIMKCIRNNLMKSPIKFNEGIADWKHLKGLYEGDGGSSKARATKLTEKNLSLNGFEKMSVKLATHVINHSVSSAMMTGVQAKQLPVEAEETAVFLKKLNYIFDSMNSRTKFHPNPYKCAVSSGSKEKHLKTPLETIEEGLKWVQTWVPAGPLRRRPPSFDGIEHTLRGTLMLWDVVKNEGASYLMTGRLNKDPLEKEFSIARQRCGYDRNLTAQRFRQNLQHRIQMSLLSPPSGKNCESDEDEILEQTSSSMKSPSLSTDHHETKELEESFDVECENEDDDEEEDIPDDVNDCMSSAKDHNLEDNSVRYIAGCAVQSTLKKFNCQSCLEGLLQKSVSIPSHLLDHHYESNITPDNSVIFNEAYKLGSGGEVPFLNPSDETCAVANTVLTMFDRHCGKAIQAVGLMKKIVFKSKQHIFKNQTNWLKTGSECEYHRNFLLNRLILTKLKSCLKEISKDL